MHTTNGVVEVRHGPPKAPLDLYSRVTPECLKGRQAVHTSCRQVYQEKRNVGVLVPTLVKVHTRAFSPHQSAGQAP
jgi:hypothetical protein